MKYSIIFMSLIISISSLWSNPSYCEESGLAIKLKSITRQQNNDLGYKLKFELVFKHDNIDSNYISSYTLDRSHFIALSSKIKKYNKKDLIKQKTNINFKVSKGEIEQAIEAIIEMEDQDLHLILYKVNVIMIAQKFNHKNGNILFSAIDINEARKGKTKFSNELIENEDHFLFEFILPTP